LLIKPDSEGRQERLKRWKILLAYSQELMINSTDKIAKKRLKKKCKEVDKVIQDETDKYREEELPTILAVKAFERARDDAERRREVDAIAGRLQQEADEEEDERQRIQEMEPNSSYLSSESAAGESEMELEDRNSFCSGGNFVEPPKLWKRPSHMDWKSINASPEHAIPNSKLMLKGRGQVAHMNPADWTDDMGIVVPSNQVNPYNRRRSSIGTESTGIEVLEKHLAEHEAEQEKHVLAKEFRKAGELEEKIKAVKAEIQNESKTGANPNNRRGSSLQSFELDSASAQSMLDKAIFGIDNSHAKDAEVKETMLVRAKLLQAKEKFYTIDADGTGLLGDDEVCELAWAGLLSDWLGCYHEDGPANLLPDSMWDGDGYTID